VQKQALLWLQKLCLLEIQIPLDVLFDMLNSGLDALVTKFGVNPKKTFCLRQKRIFPFSGVKQGHFITN